MTANPSPGKKPERMPTAIKWVIWTMLISVGATLLPLPYSLIGGAAGIAVIAAAITAMAKVGSSRGTVTLMMLVAALFVGSLSVLTSLDVALFYNAYSVQATCEAEAVTEAGRDACAEQFNDAREQIEADLLEWMGGFAPSPSAS